MRKNWVIYRKEHHHIFPKHVINEHYPRLSQGRTAAEALFNMFPDGFKPASAKEFVVLPLDQAKSVSVRVSYDGDSGQKIVSYLENDVNLEGVVV